MTNPRPDDDLGAAARRLRASDDYLNTSEEERGLGLPYDETADQLAAEGELRMTAPEVAAAERELRRLDWSGGLRRDDIKTRWPAFPLGIYLRLPASKTYYSADEALLECGLAPARAEGMFMDANPEAEFPEAQSVADGGPPGWGDQPAVYPPGMRIEGGSAEDTEGLLPGQTEDSGEPESSG